MDISITLSNRKYNMILNGLNTLQEYYFESENPTMLDAARALYTELEQHLKSERVKNNKLLVVDLKHPSSTGYCDPYIIGSFMLGRRISEYMLFIVDEHNNKKEVFITSAECTEVQSQVLDQIHNFY